MNYDSIKRKFSENPPCRCRANEGNASQVLLIVQKMVQFRLNIGKKLTFSKDFTSN